MSSTDNLVENSWVRINQEALRNNARAVLSLISKESKVNTQLMAVVKANGYGHGIANAALAFKSGGAGWFGVTSIVEALELVDAGIRSEETPILVFTPPVTKDQCKLAINHGFHVTVSDFEDVDLLGGIARELGAQASVHLKLDTGMSRFGQLPEKAFEVAKVISANPNLELTAVYTHFATAYEKNLAKTKRQFEIYVEFCTSLNHAGIKNFLKHCANSAALLRLPNTRLDIVRVGTLLYGQYPSSHMPKAPGLTSDTLALEARTVFVHDLPSGVSVGYGSEFVTKRPTRAAVLPVGFFDGVSMQPSSVGQRFRGLWAFTKNLISPQRQTVKFGNFNAPIIGRIAMQMMVVDVTDAGSAISEGDIATIPARRLAINSLLPRIMVEMEAGS